MSPLKERARSLATLCGDLLFPIICLGCESRGQWLCEKCCVRLPLRREHHCPHCLLRSTPYGQRCFDCAQKTKLEGVFLASYYRVPLLSRAIHTYKYRFVPALAEPLGAILTLALRHTELPLPDALIPVPLHRRRLKYRGFNQASLLAHTISEHLVPGFLLPVLENTLLRTRYTRPQMQAASREIREHNLSKAFSVAPEKKSLIQNARLWLIDDVVTTGTTLEECAKVLKKAGAKSVFGIALAR